jgi:hypothetical protein
MCLAPYNLNHHGLVMVLTNAGDVADSYRSCLRLFHAMTSHVAGGLEITPKGLIYVLYETGTEHQQL